MVFKNLMIVCLLLVCTNGAIAASEDADSSFSLGPAVVITQKPYKDLDTSLIPIPYIKWQMGSFYISGAKAGYRLISEDGWHLDAIAKGRFDGFKADDSDFLDGMADRRMSIDAGGELGFNGDWGEVSLSYVTDTLSEHDGQELSLIYGLPFNNAFDVDNLKLTPVVGLAWQSDNLVNYYYGVRSDEALPGRPEYKPNEALNPIVGLDTSYQYESWSFLCGIRFYILDSEITDSPIVDEDYTISLIVGAIYKF